MGRQIKNFEERARLLNEFRERNKGKKFTKDEFFRELGQLGFNQAVIYELISLDAFNSHVEDKKKFFTFKAEPIYMGKIEVAYRNVRIRKPKGMPALQITEGEAINFLKNLGYRIQKPAGFDVEAFKKANQSLYESYLKFEEV